MGEGLLLGAAAEADTNDEKTTDGENEPDGLPEDVVTAIGVLESVVETEMN